MRICKVCFKNENEVPFYSMETLSGTAAGKYCKKCWTNKSVKWRQENSEKWNKKRYSTALEKKFGINLDEYDKLFPEKICSGCNTTTNKSPRTGKDSRLALDHDHKTGKLRGLLCNKCNLILGYCNDNSKILKNLIKYLNKYK